MIPPSTSLPQMRFFRRLSSDINVASLLAEIQIQEEVWLQDTSRQDKISAQANTNTIFLRGAIRRRDLLLNENQEYGPTRISQRFPRAMAIMESAARQLNSELSRASIVRLAPQSKVHPHIDTGSYYLIRNRFHLVLHSPNGSLLASGNEQVRMRAGELWWIDNKQHHWAKNDSDDWRIHYIFDLLPSSHRHLAKNPLPPEDFVEKIVAP